MKNAFSSDKEANWKMTAIRVPASGARCVNQCREHERSCQDHANVANDGLLDADASEACGEEMSCNRACPGADAITFTFQGKRSVAFKQACTHEVDYDPYCIVMFDGEVFPVSSEPAIRTAQ